MYSLHGFCQSGNTFKVALTLNCLKQPWTPVFVDFMNGATLAPRWRESVNEMGEVPVLEVDGRRMTQSGAILTFLAERHGRFGGRDADEKQEVLRWLFFDNHKTTSYLATYRFMKAFAAKPPDPVVMAWLKSRIESAFRIVERHLEGRAFIVGTEPTIADFSICGYLFFPADESGFDWAATYPNIGRWLARIRELDGWADPYDLLPGERIAPRW